MVKIRRSFLIDWFQKSWASHFPSLGPNIYTLNSNIIMQITSPKFHLALVLEQTLLLWYKLKLRSKRTNRDIRHIVFLYLQLCHSQQRKEMAGYVKTVTIQGNIQLSTVETMPI